MKDTFLDRYKALTQSGALKPDSAQARAASVLDALDRSLKERPAKKGILATLLGSRSGTPKGVYLHGAVGRGKSFLMDLFFDSAQISPKRRIHFNAFMMETHARIHEWRGLDHSARKRRAEFVRGAGDDPVAPIAKRIASEASLLCLDEFQVTDVADAMILGRIFERLFQLGVVVVLTSNTTPERLYEGGLNRPLFLPFIALITERLDIVALDGASDYRLGRIAGLSLYNTPLGEQSQSAMDAAWKRLTGTTRGAPRTLTVTGRALDIPQTSGGVARLSFADLCERNLGAGDYVTLASSFHTLLIDNIPKLRPDQNNEARRFTLLIDSLYDERVTLICSADAPPARLFESDDARTNWFERTASRLMEMQSADYLNTSRAAISGSDK